MADEEINVRVRLKESAVFNAKTDESARRVDNLGDQAAQAARKFRQLNRATTGTRVNLGPFSTRMRGLVFLTGAVGKGIESLTGDVLAVGEAIASLVGGSAAAGGVGLTALVQGMTVAKLGVSDLSEALSGNEEAIANLGPQYSELFGTIQETQRILKEDASQGGMIEGLTVGTREAMKNFDVIRRNTQLTSAALGGIAARAGKRVGSNEWGRDLDTMGRRNVRILTNMGDAGIHVADAVRHILVTGGPLAEWLSEVAENGAKGAENFFKLKRQTGELQEFFRQSKRDLRELGSALGAGGRGLFALFGADDVDGANLLENLNKVMHRFEAWAKSPKTQLGVGDALLDEVEDATGDIVVALAEGLAESGPKAAEMFWNAFWKSSAEGKLLLGAGLLWKSGAFKMLGRRAGGLAGGLATGSGLAGLGARGTMKNPLYVIDLSSGGVGQKATQKGASKMLRGLGTAAKFAGWGGAALLGAEALDAVIPGRNGLTGPKSPGNHVAGKTPSGYADTPAGRVVERTRERYRDRRAGIGAGRPDNLLLNPGSAFKPIKLKSTIADVNMDGRKVGNAQLKHVMFEMRRRG